MLKSLSWQPSIGNTQIYLEKGDNIFKISDAEIHDILLQESSCVYMKENLRPPSYIILKKSKSMWNSIKLSIKWSVYGVQRAVAAHWMRRLGCTVWLCGKTSPSRPSRHTYKHVPSVCMAWSYSAFQGAGSEGAWLLDLVASPFSVWNTTKQVEGKEKSRYIWQIIISKKQVEKWDAIAEFTSSD